MRWGFWKIFIRHGERFQNPANELLFLKKKKSKEFYGFQKFSYEVSVPPKSLWTISDTLQWLTFVVYVFLDQEREHISWNVAFLFLFLVGITSFVFFALSEWLGFWLKWASFRLELVSLCIRFAYEWLGFGSNEPLFWLELVSLCICMLLSETILSFNLTVLKRSMKVSSQWLNLNTFVVHSLNHTTKISFLFAFCFAREKR